jgi:hypothetical protein
MKKAKHNLRMCFEPGYPDKYKMFKEDAEAIRLHRFGLWWRSLPIIIAIVNIPAGVYRSPVFLLYGVLGYTILLILLCEVRVSAKRRSMLG